jgi:hypothetical protein
LNPLNANPLIFEIFQTASRSSANILEVR